MDGKGGCCIARYGGGTYDISSVDRIMMRFRPIAPKPANTASASGASSPEISETSSRSGRGKRRLSATNGNGNRRCNNGNNNRKRKGSSEDKIEAVVTLRLLPETPDRKDTPSPGKEIESPEGVLFQRQIKNVPTWLSFGSNENGHDEMKVSGGLGMAEGQAVVTPAVMRVVIGSCVTVECITDTWVDVNGLGCTDKERRINLERDSCPGFISDDFGRVTWTNEAYKKMVGKGELVVWLVMKGEAAATIAVGSSQAFTCRVRVQNHKNGGKGTERSSITVPSDVWRMDGGGFAWRLDVKAALTLGR